MRAHRAIYVDHLAEWENCLIDPSQKSAADSGRTGQAAIDEHVAVLSQRVANLCMEAIGGEHLQLTVLKVDCSRTPHEIDVTFDVAVGDKATHVVSTRALHQQRVLKTLQVYPIQNSAECVAAEGFRL